MQRQATRERERETEGEGERGGGRGKGGGRGRRREGGRGRREGKELILLINHRTERLEHNIGHPKIQLEKLKNIVGLHLMAILKQAVTDEQIKSYITSQTGVHA